MKERKERREVKQGRCEGRKEDVKEGRLEGSKEGWCKERRGRKEAGKGRKGDVK